MNQTSVDLGSVPGTASVGPGSGVVDKTAGGVESLREPAADKLDVAADALHKRSGRLPGAEALGGAARAAADRLKSSATYLKSHEAGEIMDDALGILKRYPVQALLIAGALGFITARALRSRN